MKNFAQKRSSIFKAIAFAACIGIMIILFVVIFQQSQYIKEITVERDQLQQDLAEKAIEISLYDEKFDDYKRELILSFEKNLTQEEEKPGLTTFQIWDDYFADINFEDGLDSTELYWYGKQKPTADNSNMLKMFTEQLELDNQLLELLKHAQACATQDSAESISIEGYIAELVDQINRLAECKAQCEKNLAELADYENVCPQP